MKYYRYVSGGKNDREVNLGSIEATSLEKAVQKTVEEFSGNKTHVGEYYRIVNATSGKYEYADVDKARRLAGR